MFDKAPWGNKPAHGHAPQSFPPPERGENAEGEERPERLPSHRSPNLAISPPSGKAKDPTVPSLSIAVRRRKSKNSPRGKGPSRTAMHHELSPPPAGKEPPRRRDRRERNSPTAPSTSPSRHRREEREGPAAARPSTIAHRRLATRAGQSDLPST